jgi:hypothetical protein
MFEILNHAVMASEPIAQLIPQKFSGTLKFGLRNGEG